jgi:prepilin-type N-terminal cleavage/methylation domain-containing protein
MLRNKVSAFSLVEMLVVLVLSSMVAGIVYFSYRSVSLYYLTLDQKRIEVENLSGLNYLLKKDFEEADLIMAMNPRMIEITNGSSSKINYEFFKNYSVRFQDMRVDTFALSCDSIAYRWVKRIQNFYPGCIDKISLEVTREESGPFRIGVVKLYDAASLIVATQKDSIQ